MSLVLVLSHLAAFLVGVWAATIHFRRQRDVLRRLAEAWGDVQWDKDRAKTLDAVLRR